MGWKIHTEGGGAKFTATWDDRQWKAATHEMKRQAREVFQKAIEKVLRQTRNDVYSMLKKGDSNEKDIADSLIVETGEQGQGFLGPADAAVRAGADPVEEGGPTAKRGGKIAVYYEYGVQPFKYPFAVGIETRQGFINVNRSPKHPGFKKTGNVGWLTSWYNKAVPQMPDAIQDAIQKAWGGR